MESGAIGRRVGDGTDITGGVASRLVPPRACISPPLRVQIRLIPWLLKFIPFLFPSADIFARLRTRCSRDC